MPSKLPGYLTRIACCILLCTLPILLFAQNDDDISNAAYYGKKFKDEDIMCMSSYRYFTFDKGKNSLNDKVVTIEENAEYEFLSLNTTISLSYSRVSNEPISMAVNISWWINPVWTALLPVMISFSTTAACVSSPSVSTRPDRCHGLW